MYLLLRKKVPFFNQLSWYRDKILKTQAGEPKAERKKISTPRVLGHFSPVAAMVKGAKKMRLDCANSPSSCKNKTRDRKGNYKISQFDPSVKNEAADFTSYFDSGNPPNSTTESHTAPSDFTENVNNLEETKEPSIVLCECGNPCFFSSKVCVNCSISQNPREIKGFLYTKKENSSLERHWFHLLNKELYCITNKKIQIIGYEEKDDKKYEYMIELTQTTVTEEKGVFLDNTITLYPIVLNVLSKKTILYAFQLEDKDKWIQAFKDVIGYPNIFKLFNIKVIILTFF